MRFKDTFEMAKHNLLLNRKRSILAMIGIAVGVLGVLVMGIVGSSGQKMIFEEIKTFGLQTVWVYRDTQNAIPGQETVNGSGIELSDSHVLSRSSRWIKAISGVIERRLWVSKETHLSLEHILYIEPAYFSIENDTLIAGRILNQADMDFAKHVCVIGQDTAKALFGTQKVIGQTVTIANSEYEVVGVLAKKDRDILKSIGVGNGENPNGRVLIPLSVMLSESDTQDLDYLQLAALTTQDSDKAGEEAKQALTQHHHGEFSYTHTAMKNYIESFGRISKIVSTTLAIAVFISLLIGGIGIANVMTIAVVERTKEIGVRKSVGATPQDIFQLFLAEAILLTSCAGGIGIILGTGIGLLGLWILPHTFVFPLKFIFISLGVSILTGVISGVYPAIDAAQKKPVEALRYE